jgi:thiosulfate/3-mercaptopyruvate sulfurtransferase
MSETSNLLVDTAWMLAHLDDPNVCLIEVNWTETQAYDSGHIPGALGWNWKEWLWDPMVREFPSPDEFARRCGDAGISNNTTVVFQGEPIQFGTYGWWVFKLLQHADCRILDGGKTRWVNEGHSLTTDNPSIESKTYTPPSDIESTMRASRDEVLESLKKFKEGAEMVLLDHRSPEEFNGELVNVPGMPDVGAERYGRIPGSRHLHFSDLLNKDTTFKTPDELRTLFEAQGAYAHTDIVSYCRLSHRATLAYFLMKEILGYKNVRSYDGSWTEWGSMVGMPIER